MPNDPNSIIDAVIRNCNSWDEFCAACDAQPSTMAKGDLFERLTQLYLQSHSEYRTKLTSVWQLSEVPPKISKRLNLPNHDEGIDLIAKTNSGDFWSIQCKYRSDTDKALTTRDLAKFSSLSFAYCDEIEFGVIVHSSSKPVRKQKLLGNVTEIGLARWLDLTSADWEAVHALTKGEVSRPKNRTPRPHQRRAIRDAERHFVGNRQARGRMIMPCGSGKSLTAFWIAQQLEAKCVVVAVPSLALLKQSLEDWTLEYLAIGEVPEWLCVCSDESIGGRMRDEVVSDVYEMGVETTTNVEKIRKFLKRSCAGPRVIFTTYQSSPRLSEAAAEGNTKFDICILDEAHKTVGQIGKAFAHLLFDENLICRRRLFMTATERVLRSEKKSVLSMDDEAVYGECFHQLTFKKAIEEKIICDYRILTVAISDTEIRQLVEENKLLTEKSEEGNEREARALAAGVALIKAYGDCNVKHAISFHRSIKAAEGFREQQDALSNIGSLQIKSENMHISSRLSAGERSLLMRAFANHDRALMTNARCLTEGVDIPAIDCVVFADPKKSVVDVVQAAGRAMRLNESTGKKLGYILLPLVVPEKLTFVEFYETTEFKAIIRTIAALSTQDERIVEEFRLIEEGRKPAGPIVELSGDVSIGTEISFSEFAEHVEACVWKYVGQLNWRPFEQARAYARSLELKNNAEWRNFYKTRNRPADIPAAPEQVYKHTGWISYGDWLGTGAIAARFRKFRPFEEARDLARGLQLKGQSDWRAFTTSGNLPDDVPSNPSATYKDEGWVNFGDWLGTGRIATRLKVFRPFNEAREFTRSLKLKNFSEWQAFLRSGELPGDIPSSPSTSYKNDGWVDLGDWLGTGQIAVKFKKFRAFEEARKYARSLGLKNVSEWQAFAVSGKKPADIPSAPNWNYREEGWVSYGDWLGTGTIANQSRKYRSFEEARKFARSLKLRKTSDWLIFTKSGELPADVPAYPREVYGDKGWSGYGNWLGTYSIHPRLRKFRSFDDAREYARRLELKDQSEWKAFAKSDKRPVDIPSNPNQVYKDSGWAGIRDWLGIVKQSNQQLKLI